MNILFTTQNVVLQRIILWTPDESSSSGLSLTESDTLAIIYFKHSFETFEENNSEARVHCIHT